MSSKKSSDNQQPERDPTDFIVGEGDRPPGKRLHKLRTGSFDRSFSMAKMGLITGTQVAGHELLNLFRSDESRRESDREFYRRQAEFLAEELGQLKGSVMKVGQMLSVYGQYFMPPEAVEVLRSLQDDTAHVDWELMEPVIESRLGEKRMAELEIEREPLAAASLGQVHRARRRRDGRELCVKIQYPDLDKAIDSDIRTMTRLVQLARLAPRGVELKHIMEEVRDMLHREVDYDRELRMTQEFARRLAGDERYVVPEAFPEYSTDKVLTTSYEAASHVRGKAVQGLSQARRDRLARNALDLFFTEFFDWGLVQTDPHFGNYRVRIDDQDEQDRLVLLDFGATRDFRPAFLQAYHEVVRGAFYGDQARLIQGAIELGLLRKNSPQQVYDHFAKVGFLIMEPFAEVQPEEWLTDDGEYRWGETDLPWRVSKAVSRAAISRWFRIPPREIVFLHRRLGGVFVLLAVLRAQLAGRARLRPYLES